MFYPQLIFFMDFISGYTKLYQCFLTFYPQYILRMLLYLSLDCWIKVKNLFFMLTIIKSISYMLFFEKL